MDTFIQQYGKYITGHLSGFDRIVLRGTLRALVFKDGMRSYLWKVGAKLEDLSKVFEEKTKQLKQASCEEARRLQRPIIYMESPKISKEKTAREIAESDGIKEGLICVLSSVEPCKSFEVSRNREKKIIELRPRIRKCSFLYHYWMDPVFGFMNARIQSWFPLSIQVCLNGREWLARQMDKVGMRYHKQENCFPWIKNVKKAQKLMDEQLRINWPDVLNGIAKRLNPVHEEMLSPFRADYYWTMHQTEWATDIMFKSQEAMVGIWPTFVQSAISVFGSTDVMRFLGKKPHGNFQGDVVTHYGKRVEGIRVKHQVNGNGLKIYNRGIVGRVETTINNPTDFKVFRPKEGDPAGKPIWRQMRKGIADCYRRAQISQASNERYLDALASLKVDRSLIEVVQPICKPTRWKKQRVRALRPWSKEDSTLLAIISRGEFNINGFRNRDIVAHLFPGDHELEIRRRLSARVTHRLRILRAHGIIRRVNRTLRYVLTPKGRRITAAILNSQHAKITKLLKLVA